MEPLWVLVAALVAFAAFVAVVIVAARTWARRRLDRAPFRAAGSPHTPFTLVIPGGTGRAHDVFLRWAARWRSDPTGDQLTVQVTVTVGGAELHRATFVVGDDRYGTPLPVSGARGLDASITSGSASGTIRQADAIVRAEAQPAGRDTCVTVVAMPRPSAKLERLELLALA
ncbi:MAG: hypothetical protein JNL38_12870 [Myxococcales bacterium]|jgi:hypothetical protein|nr:hypothetical protein [Myxococcales bacterium]